MRYLISILALALSTINAAASVAAEEDAAAKAAETPSVKITSLKNGNVVKSRAFAEGTCRPSTVDNLWVFVTPQHSSDLVFPQSKNGTQLRCEDGKWSTPVFFGGKRQLFHVSVYVGTADASKEIEAFLAARRQGRKKGYPGMRLPDGLVEQASVWVDKH